MKNRTADHFEILLVEASKVANVLSSETHFHQLIKSNQEEN